MAGRIASWTLVMAALGCQAASGPATQAPQPGDFTVVLIPDTQYYMGEHLPLLESQIQWIADHKDEFNIVFAIHLGDMTNTNTLAEWQIMDRIMGVLDRAGVPWSAMPGNHDGISRGVIDSGNYNRFFGVSRFQGKPWYGGHYGDTNDSNYSFFQAAGMEFMVLSLAFGTPEEQLDWADQVLARYPDKRVIFATHAYLDDDGTYLERGDEFAVSDSLGRWNDGKQIWDKVVRNHGNVFLTASGHVPEQGRRTSTGAQGNRVHEVLANYQGIARGGSGYLRLLRFSPARDVIQVEAYSPPLDTYLRDSRHSFVLDYSMSGSAAGSN